MRNRTAQGLFNAHRCHITNYGSGNLLFKENDHIQDTLYESPVWPLRLGEPGRSPILRL